jgi:hypothetical protein
VRILIITDMTRLRLITLTALLSAGSVWSLAAHGQTAARREPPPIEDNSILIEEAYNQEPGIIQHISTFNRNRFGDFAFTFTQEWPIFGRKHQFSYTIPINRTVGVNDVRGFGDVALNYRYQLIDNDRVAVAPRATLLLPTGDERRGLGKGGVGFQFNVPVSTTLSRRFVTHTNVGATLSPRARNVLREMAATKDYFVGQSLIWLTKPRFNVMFEALYEWRDSVTGPRRTAREDGCLANPGVRWAHNFKNGLQIVPGVSFPLGVGPSQGERGVFFYLSFEHRLWKPDEE